MRVRFAAVVTALSLSTLPTNPVHNASVMFKPSMPLPVASGESEEMSVAMAKHNIGNSLWQFTVTLVCNVTGWPDPVIKWSTPQKPVGEPTNPETNIPGFQVFTHPWSLTQKSSVGVIRNATCLDNGVYSCFSFNTGSINTETLPSYMSNQSVLLDLPCPPVDLQNQRLLPSLASGEFSTKLYRNNDVKRFENDFLNKKLCQSNSGSIESDGESEIVVAELNTITTIRACFIGNPKPTLEFRRLGDGLSNTRSDYQRREVPSLNSRKHIPIEHFPKFLQNQEIGVKADGQLNVKNKNNAKAYDISRDVGTKRKAIKKNKPRFNDKVNGVGDELVYDYVSLPSFNNTFAQITADVHPLTVQCSGKDSSSFCFAEINITITSPIQYGLYEVMAKNSHGITRRKYRIVSRQAPLAPYHFRLENVSSALACFSWKENFNGGAKQSFHLCFRRDTGALGNLTKSESVEDQTEVDNSCKPLTIQSNDLPMVSDKGDHQSRTDSDSHHFHTHCQSLLIPSTRYNATIFSTNQYGRSKEFRSISFQTKPKLKPVASFLTSTAPSFSKVFLSVSATEDSAAHSTELGKTTPSLAAISTGPLQPPLAIFAVDEDGDVESELLANNQKIQLPDLSKEDNLLDHDILKDTGQAQKSSEEDNEDAFLDELLFDEDDLIYGEINDIPFFQLFGVHPPIYNDFSDEHLPKSSTKNLLPYESNSTAKKAHLIRNRHKSPPVHLQKLLLRYSRPHSKLKIPKTEISSKNISFISFTSPTPSNSSSAQPMTTVSFVTRDKEATPSPVVTRHRFLMITSTAGVAFTIAMVVLSLICLRLFRRHRKLTQLKRRYQQRMTEKANLRRRYPSVQVEDANIAGNRLSSLRGRPPSHPWRFNPQAPPMLLPRKDVTQISQPQDLDLKRKSITCVSNENAFYFPPASALQDSPSRLPVNNQNLAQRQLRPTSSTPAIGKVADQLKKEKSGERASVSFSASSSPTPSKNQLAVPTITIGEDCSFSRTCPPISIPSYLDLHTDNNELSFDLDPYHGRHEHLRPPSHHSSYSSIRQGAPLLLRLDSSSSGATGNYFNLYEGLTSKSSRSRSPSNVYDPLTFELCARSNPPSRRGSHVKGENRIDKTIPIDKNTNGKTLPLNDTYVSPDAGSISDKSLSMSCQADQVNVYQHSGSEPFRSDSVLTSSSQTTTEVGAYPKMNLENQKPALDKKLASEYERIVGQSTVFFSEKKSSVKENDFSFGSQKPRKSLDLRNLFRSSFPRNSGKTDNLNVMRDTATPVGSVSTLKNREKRPTMPPSRSDMTLNKDERVNNGISRKTVCRIPILPASNLERLHGLEEPIYADIDDDSENGKTIPYLHDCNNRHNSNSKTNTKHNSGGNSNCRLAEPSPPNPCLKAPRASFSKTFVSLSSILSQNKSLSGKTSVTEKFSSDSSACCHSILPDIMLCTDKGNSEQACEEEAYSTIDFAAGV